MRLTERELADLRDYIGRDLGQGLLPARFDLELLAAGADTISAVAFRPATATWHRYRARRLAGPIQVIHTV